MKPNLQHQEQDDPEFECLEELLYLAPVLRSAKLGWARPAMLSLEEVQALCKELVMLEFETGLITKRAV